MKDNDWPVEWTTLRSPPRPSPPGSTAIELSDLRQDRSADFSPLPAVLAGPERGGLKSALLNSMAVLSGSLPARSTRERKTNCSLLLIASPHAVRDISCLPPFTTLLSRPPQPPPPPPH